MDPLVSLYYFAPACMVMNGLATLVFEVPKMTMADIWGVGIGNLVANASVAFALNVAVVFLVRKISSPCPGSICCSLTIFRLAKLPPLFSPFLEFSRIFYLSLRPWSFSVILSHLFKHLDTALH